MRPLTSKDHQPLVLLLLWALKFANTVEINIEQRLADSLDLGALGSPLKSANWEYILRELLFKTISPLPLADNKLYKELLEAPFYARPFSAGETLNYDGEVSEVLSRGDVYHLGEGSWIICQEDCTDCDICAVQRSLNIPTVRWILRKIQRYVPFNYVKRNDVQLIVLPQGDDSFRMKNPAQGSHVYVNSNSGDFPGFTNTLIRRNKNHAAQYPFVTAKSPESPGTSVDEVFPLANDKGHGIDEEKAVTEGLQGSFNEIFQTNSQLKITTTSIPTVNIPYGRKRGREILRGRENQDRIQNTEDRREGEQSQPTQNSTPLTVFLPPTVPTTVSIVSSDCEKEKSTRLILGRDEFGEKHVVHIVPAGDLDRETKRPSIYPGVQLDHRRTANPLLVNTEQEGHTLYRKVFRRVMDSLNTHKNAIEKFLLSPKREVHPGHKEILTTAEKMFYQEGTVVEDHDENNTANNNTIVAAVGTGMDNETVSDLISSSYDGREIITGHGEETSATLTTTEESYEEDQLSTKSYRDEVQLNAAENQTEQLNNSLEYFYESSLPDEFLEDENNSESLILKEVAKSVVKQPADTFDGFKSVANNNLDPESDYPLPIILERNTENTEHLGKREKSRRHV